MKQQSLEDCIMSIASYLKVEEQEVLEALQEYFGNRSKELDKILEDLVEEPIYKINQK
ncbi:MAG TPA: hypothetical protein VFV86_02340 [Nitrososphaeraceae archaeon]|nr:hypothetical protein [Nitrososphaeraceae archaeon]